MIAADHLVICGFGAIGSAAACALMRHGRGASDIWVIETDNVSYEEARKRGCRTICGDATNISRLRAAHVGGAKDVIVSVGDRSAAPVTQAVREVAPSATVKVALRCAERENEVRAAGASEVILLSMLAGTMLAESVKS